MPPKKKEEPPKQETPKPAKTNEKMLVRAVNRIGYYGDRRRFPVGHSHPKAGEPFWIYKHEFSDYRAQVSKGLFGWMQLVNDKAPAPKIDGGSSTVPWENPKPTGAQAPEEGLTEEAPPASNPQEQL